MNASRASPLTSLYVVGPLSMGYVDFYTFLIPLYALSLGFDAGEIGILVGARSIVAMFLSIHKRWPALSGQVFALNKWNLCRLPSWVAVFGVACREGVARPE